MSVAEAQQEIQSYVGIPKCQTCGWKFGSDITDYCGCISANKTPERQLKHEAAYQRARELQAIIEQAK